MYKLLFLCPILFLSVFISCDNNETIPTTNKNNRDVLLDQKIKLLNQELLTERKKYLLCQLKSPKSQGYIKDSLEQELIIVQAAMKSAIEDVNMLSLFQEKLTSDLNEMFLEWGNRWSIDNYVHKSVKIQKIGKNSNPWRITGSFSFTRIGKTKAGIFTSTIRKTEDGFSISNLCYEFMNERNCDKESVK